MSGETRFIKRAISRGAIALAITLAVATGLSAPALAYETPELTSTDGSLFISNSWGSLDYGHSSAKGWADKTGFRLAVKAKYRELGVTSWTSYKWNLAVYGGYVSVNAYVCQTIKIQY